MQQNHSMFKDQEEQEIIRMVLEITLITWVERREGWRREKESFVYMEL